MYSRRFLSEKKNGNLIRLLGKGEGRERLEGGGWVSKLLTRVKLPFLNVTHLFGKKFAFVYLVNNVLH